MNFQTSRDYPTRPADFIERGAETLSRMAGVAAFFVVLFALLYLMAE